MLQVTVKSFADAQECPFRAVLDKLGDKWTILIIAVLEDEPQRFNEIKRLVGDISQRVLTAKLRELERDGYVTRKVYPESPPRVEYALSDLGRSVLDPVTQLMNWALKSHGKVRQARIAYAQSQSGADAGEP